MYTTEIFIPLLQILATNEVRRRKTVFLFKQQIRLLKVLVVKYESPFA